MDLEKDAYRYAIKNAFLHNGKADLNAVIGKIMALHTGINLKEAMPILQKTVKKVNSMKFEKIKQEFERFESSYELKIPEKKEGLEELEWAKTEKVVTRFAPNPNGPFHLGSARAAVLSWEYAKQYNGKFILRFDDTDPKVKKPIENAEQMFEEDLSWLGIKPDEIYFASDRLNLYYDFMEKLLEMGKAYVCLCDVNEWREKIAKGEACKCRNKKPSEQLKLFEKMLNNTLKEGEAVLRIKTDLKHRDPSVRDWWAAKIVNEPQHPRVSGKHVWPSYNFASAIDDHALGITLIIRGQEHAQNMVKQEFLYKYFGWKYPHTFHTGRIKLENIVLSTSQIKKGIEEGKYIGWDDPRIGTIRAFRRKGFTPEALKMALLEVGVKSADTTIELKTLAAYNKKVLGEVERVTFLQDTVRLSVIGCPATKVDIEGKKYFLREGSENFVVSKKDFENIQTGKVFRLRNAYNARVKEKSDFEILAEFTGKAKIEPIVYWLKEGIDVEVMMPNAEKVYGLSDSKLATKKVGEHLHFEKFGYVRIDQVDKKRVSVWFSHE